MNEVHLAARVFLWGCVYLPLGFFAVALFVGLMVLVSDGFSRWYIGRRK